MPEQPRSQAKPQPFSKVRTVNSRVSACSTILQTANCVRRKGGELRVGGSAGRDEAPAGGGARVDRVLIPGPARDSRGTRRWPGWYRGYAARRWYQKTLAGQADDPLAPSRRRA